MARKLSDRLRRECAVLSKWGTHPLSENLLTRAADELDRRAAEIRKLKIIAKPDAQGSHCTICHGDHTGDCPHAD